MEEYIAVKEFLKIRRRLSELDAGAVLFTAKAMIECKKIADEILEE